MWIRLRGLSLVIVHVPTALQLLCPPLPQPLSRDSSGRVLAVSQLACVLAFAPSYLYDLAILMVGRFFMQA